MLQVIHTASNKSALKVHNFSIANFLQENYSGKNPLFPSVYVWPKIMLLAKNTMDQWGTSQVTRQ